MLTVTQHHIHLSVYLVIPPNGQVTAVQHDRSLLGTRKAMNEEQTYNLDFYEIDEF